MLETSWQWALSKVYGLTDGGSPATVLGTGCHAAVEAWLRRRMLRQRDGLGLPDLTRQEMVDAGMVALRTEAGQLDAEAWRLHDVTPAILAEQLEIAVHHWWDTPDPATGQTFRGRVERWRIVAVEPYFRAGRPVSARPLHGYIDLLAYDPDADDGTGQWVVVDHKTANTFSRWQGAAGHELEATVYTVGATVARNLPATGTVRMEWHIVRKAVGRNRTFQGARLVTLEPDVLEERWMDDHVQVADRIVAESDYVTNTSWNLCSPKWCGFYRGCQVTGDLSPAKMGDASVLVD